MVYSLAEASAKMDLKIQEVNEQDDLALAEGLDVEGPKDHMEM